MLRSKRVSLYVALATSLASALSALPAPLRAADPQRCAGVSLPASERAFGVGLVLNGMGIRRVSILNLQAYVAGLYLEQRTQNPAEVWPRERTKLMVFTHLRDAERQQMIDMIRSAIDAQPAHVKALAQKNLPDFERRLPDPRKGTRLSIGYGKGRLELRHEGKLAGAWEDPGLAEALFRVWLGSKPSDVSLKQGLLGGECQ